MIGSKLSVILRETERLTTFYPLASCQHYPACVLRFGDLDTNKPHLVESAA
jgi:hypothetical protein